MLHSGPPGSDKMPAVRAALFDALVALHVASALIGFGAVAFSGVYGFVAGRVAAGRPGREEAQRYFASSSPAEWLLLPVPFLGVGALAAHPHGHGVAQLWAGLAAGVWLVAAVTLLAVVRPAERAIRAGMTGSGPLGSAGTAGAVGAAVSRAASRLGWAAVGTDIGFTVALMLMIWQPR